MLGKKRKEQKIEESKGKVETILGEGTKIKGNIFTRGSMRIEGEVEGKIEAEGDIFVGEKGIVDTEITARNVVVAGKINGNVLAKEKLEIMSSGRISGDIQTDTLKIEAGANFTGSSRPLKKEQEKSKKEAAASKAAN